MNITILAKKGGVGKSTVSLLLYEAFRKADHRVAVRDWDPQGTSNKSLWHRGLENPDRPHIVIWDTPPSLEHVATATAVRNSSIVLVVTTPSPADIWEADDAVRFARSKNPDARVMALVNKFDHDTVLGRLIDESVKDISAPTLGVRVGDRECYKHVLGLGWKALNVAAREEVLDLVVAVLTMQTGEPGLTGQSQHSKQEKQSA